MSFSFNTDAIIAKQYNGSNFVERDLTVSGSVGIGVTPNSEGNFTIDGSTLSGNLSSEITSEIASYSGYVETEYVNVDGDTMTGFLTLHADPTASGHSATKQYVDDAVAGGVSASALDVKDDGSVLVGAAASIDYGHALVVVSGAGSEADVAVDESEFTTVVTLTGAQTISGEKTFADNVIIEGDLTVTGTTTTLNTAELLVEDNIITLNSTYSGSGPTIDAGIEVERGTLDNAQLIWDESEDRFFASNSTVSTLEKVILESDLTTAVSA